MRKLLTILILCCYGCLAAQITGVDVQTACNSYTWIDGNTYTASTNTPTYTLTTAAGIDSVVTLHLTINYSSSGMDVRTACDSFTWINGVTYHASNYDATYTLTNAVGCDSVVWLNLTIINSPDSTISGTRHLCPDTSIIITGPVADTYQWNTGATTQSITVNNTGTYRLTATNLGPDNRPCPTIIRHPVSVSYNPILSVSHPDICSGYSYMLSVGYQDTCTIPLFVPVTTLSMADTIFLPDGIYCAPHGCSYRSPLTFTSYGLNDIVQSVEDIKYVRLNIEHSWVGDIYINITCPNGQKADIMKYGGTGSSDCNSHITSSSRGWQSGDNTYVGSHFGQAYDYESSYDDCNPNAFGNEPGIGWNYCWSNNTEEGYSYAPGAGSLVYRSANVHGGIIDSSNVAAGTHFYHPDQSFSNLIGCPLNGSWYIEVLDGWSGDNGYIFGWELALRNDELTQTSVFTNATIDGPWVTPLSDSLFRLDPPSPFDHDTTVTYSIHLLDDFGCQYDTTVNVEFYASYDIPYDTSVCVSYRWEGETYTSSGQYVRQYTTRHGCDSILTLNLSVGGLYESSIEDKVCEGKPYKINGFNIPASKTIDVEELTDTLHLFTQNGCDSIVSLHLTVTDTTMSIISLTPDFCDQETAELEVLTDAIGYVWSTGETTPTIWVTHSGTYTVSATTEDCALSAHYRIPICEHVLRMPNAIAPSNPDGHNLLFQLPEDFQERITNCEVLIYNRWGELVFYSKDKYFKWDGSFHNQIHYNTVYNYVIIYSMETDGPYRLTGTVTVL